MNTKIIELIIDEENEDNVMPVSALSLVEIPAIESDFIYLKDNKSEFTFAQIDKEKRIIAGAGLIPNKQIYRLDRNTGGAYYIWFSKDTVKRASELFLQQGRQNSATAEHKEEITGVSVVESWIIEDKENDKSNMYGFDLPVGTWFVVAKIENDSIWKQIRENKYKGFSVEGYFSSRLAEFTKVGKDLYNTIEEAEKRALKIGCKGSHSMQEGFFMPCVNHDEYENTIMLKRLREIITKQEKKYR